jgi:DNA uptake protein ComE-like DNA-binding protein
MTLARPEQEPNNSSIHSLQRRPIKGAPGSIGARLTTRGGDQRETGVCIVTTLSSSAPRRRIVLRAGLAMSALALLAACGGSPAGGSTQPATATQSTAAQPTATPAATAQPTATSASAAAPTATAAQGKPTAPAPTTPTQPAQPAPTQAAAKLNLNTATAEQFRTIPGVGDRMVREFEEYRPYTSILQFRREIGKYVSQEQVAAYERYMFVPVNPNTADAETLRQLPGVDAALAAQLIAARPYASTDAFLTKLGQALPADQAAAARAYLVAA